MKYLILVICLFGIFGCQTTEDIASINKAVIIGNCLTDVKSLEDEFMLESSFKNKINIKIELALNLNCENYPATADYKHSSGKLMYILLKRDNENLSQDEYKQLKNDFDVELENYTKLKKGLLIVRDDILKEIKKRSEK